MKINLMTLLLFSVAALLAASLLGSRVLVLIAVAVCAAAVYFAVRVVRLHQRMNRSGEDDAGGR